MRSAGSRRIQVCCCAKKDSWAVRVHQHALTTGLLRRDGPPSTYPNTTILSHSSSSNARGRNSIGDTTTLTTRVSLVGSNSSIISTESAHHSHQEGQRRFASSSPTSSFTLSHSVPHYIRAKNVKTCLKSINAILSAGPLEGVLLSDVARELPDEQMEAMEEGLKGFILSEAKEIIAIRKNPQGKVILCLYSNDSAAVKAGDEVKTGPMKVSVAPPPPRGAPVPQAPPPTKGVPVATGPPASSDGSMSPSNYIISLPLVERFSPPRELPGKQADILIEMMCKCPLKAFSLLTAIKDRDHLEQIVHIGFNSPITRSFNPFSIVAVRKDWRRYIKFNTSVAVSNPNSEEVVDDERIIQYDAEIVQTLERLQNVYNDPDSVKSFLASHFVFATLNSQYAEQILESDAVINATTIAEPAPMSQEDDGSDDQYQYQQVDPAAAVDSSAAVAAEDVVEEYDVMRIARYVPVEDYIPLEELFPLSGQVSTKDPIQVLLSAPDLFEFNNKYAPTAVKFILNDRYIPALFTESSLDELTKEVVSRCLARKNEKQQRRMGEHKRKIELAKIALSMKMFGRQSIADPRVLSMFIFDIMKEHPVELPLIETSILGVSKKHNDGSLQFYHDFENDAYNLLLPPDLVARMKTEGVVSPFMALKAIKQQLRSPVQVGGGRSQRGGEQQLSSFSGSQQNTFAHERWKQAQILQEHGLVTRVSTPCPFVFNQSFYRYAPVYEKFPHLFYVFETAQRNRMISRADLDPPAAAETQRELTPDDLLTVMKQAVDGAQQSQTPNAIIPFLEEGKDQGVPDLITYANIGSVSRQLPLFVCKRIRAMYHGVNRSVFAGYLADNPEHFEYVLLGKSGTYFVRNRRKGLDELPSRNKNTRTF